MEKLLDSCQDKSDKGLVALTEREQKFIDFVRRLHHGELHRIIVRGGEVVHFEEGFKAHDF